MRSPIPLDLVRLRRSCADCSLRELCLPAGVDRDDMGRLDTMVQRRRSLGRGDSLFRTGDPLHAVYVATNGAFKTVVVNEAGEEHVLGFHLPGELFGLDAIGSGRHRCQAVALGEATVCELPFASLSAVATELPSLQRQLLRVMGQSADRDHDHVDVLSRRQASERVALFLQGLGERYQRIDQPGDDFQLPMSRDEIARYLGLALETVSRGFSRLHEDGVIDVRGRRIRILDAPALQAAASGCEAEVPRGGARRTRA
ncbi:helix-turn-helix domain-containing protein [Thermomonas carbonis]|uniref:CRP-like protein Clp n=1 Tax=Thermomonas carbonis TaxID=1463158 RepID=A0A7G9SQG8_9GAMM|nr:helix-turn-helix domain-containing protein [Thermomonas carbonis]QNN70093.1 helix-turn-helix domain-containing protein [Thermomonas carbonis]GHB97711.1 transcriptional activator protein anr [Thermomonas carbonis]